jgi:hypothetical protein
MEGDSDDDGTDSEAEWPSLSLDLGRDLENSLEEREERNRAVAKWTSATSNQPTNLNKREHPTRTNL